MKAGIIGCGVYIPRLRIKRTEYEKTWGYFAPRWLEEKTVPDFDEDSITMATEAAANALRNTRLDVSQIDALYFASTSPPYAEKGNASTVATALGCRGDISTLDSGFSTICGTAALLSGLDYIESARGNIGLIVAADAPLADPTGSIEHQMGAGAAAVLLGRDKLGAVIEGSHSIIKESLGERFRGDGHRFLQSVDVAGYRDTLAAEIIASCVKGLLEKLRCSAKDYAFFALQGVDDARALDVARRIGFEDKQVTPTMISGKIGDSGSASPILALCRALESASLEDRLMVCSYGPGAGADALSLRVEGEMKALIGLGFEDYLLRKEYIDYSGYLKLRGLLGGGK